MTEPMLEPVDEVEVLTVMDNSLDILMAGSPVAQRAKLKTDALSLPQLRAEHGVSMLVTVRSGGHEDSFLFDTGVSADGALHNMDVLEVRPNQLHAVVLSHGHTDHTNGLSGMMQRYGRARLPVMLHPEAFLERKVVFPDGQEIGFPAPNRRDLEAEGVEVVEAKGHTLLVDRHALISGQIPRVTSFEQGMPVNQAQIDGQWQPDPWIHDDQAIIIHVRGKGLVILTGCGHAGVINTLLYARTLTGVNEIYALIGGFHLTGALFEPIIPPTIQALREFSPKVMVPQHCTGWRATHEIAREFPDAFIASSVGTRYAL